jgi:hypothetical protein
VPELARAYLDGSSTSRRSSRRVCLWTTSPRPSRRWSARRGSARS